MFVASSPGLSQCCGWKDSTLIVKTGIVFSEQKRYEIVLTFNMRLMNVGLVMTVHY